MVKVLVWKELLFRVNRQLSTEIVSFVNYLWN